MFPLSQPALCLDSRGGGKGVCLCVGGGSTLKQRVQGRKEGAAEGGGISQMRREGEGKREMEGLAFQKAIDRLPLKISYWISLTETAF